MNEKSIGSITYAPLLPDGDLHHVIFTESKILSIPVSKITKAAQKGAALGVIAMAFGSGLNPSPIGGVAGLVARSVWNNLKKKEPGNSFVKIESGEITDEVQSMASISKPYDKVKEVSIKKMFGSEDYVIHVGKGFFSTDKWVIRPEAVADVQTLISKTPLAQVLKK